MKIEPRIWKHTFLQGDDEETLRTLRAEADRLEREMERKAPRKGQSSEPRLMGEPDPYTEAKSRYEAKAAEADAFAAEAEPRGVTVVLRSVGRKRWRELVAANPPREGNEEDAKAGFNLDDFPEALVPACITSLGGEERSFSEGEMADFLDSLTPAQFDLLATAAYQLHNNLGANPKERLLSAPAQS